VNTVQLNRAICKNANIVNNYKIPAELFITPFMTNAERLNNIYRPAEEDTIKFLPRQIQVIFWL